MEREVRHESPCRFLSFCRLEIKSPLVFKWLDYNYSPFSQDKAQLRKYMYEGDVESTRLKQDVFGNVFMPKLPPGALKRSPISTTNRNSTTQPYQWRIVAISDKIQSQKQWRFEKLLKKAREMAGSNEGRANARFRGQSCGAAVLVYQPLDDGTP